MPKAAYRSLPWFILTNENLFFIFANFNWFHVIFRFRVHLRLKMAEENYWKRRIQWSASIKSVNFLKEFFVIPKNEFLSCVVAKQIKTTQCFLMYAFCLFVCLSVLFRFFRLRFRRVYDSAYCSDYWFSRGHKRSHNSDSVAIENHP